MLFALAASRHLAHVITTTTASIVAPTRRVSRVQIATSGSRRDARRYYPRGVKRTTTASAVAICRRMSHLKKKLAS